MSMVTFEDIYKIRNVEGVEQYLLVDADGLIKHNHFDSPEKMAQVLFASMKYALSIAKNRFKYIKFARKNNDNLYIFPIGKYCLGVVKQKTINDAAFQDNMIAFLNRLVKMKQS